MDTDQEKKAAVVKLEVAIDEAHASIKRGEGLTPEAFERRHKRRRAQKIQR